ncbi:hypothetical protein BDV93DRAFT_542935 [Ceratobasidium sp. AG-I]|nr:hypothetical protein BDV93DRAFT_542935 [Ceratobasidium sp. AG-I]
MKSKSTKSRSAFTSVASLNAYAPFQQLDDTTKSTLRQLVTDKRLNPYGRFKRAPNVWLIFRSDVLAHIQDKTKTQSQVTIESKSKWGQTSKQDRAEFQERAEEQLEDLLEAFPDYKFYPLRPGEKERWGQLESSQKKDFWLASAVRIARRINNPEGSWPGMLSFEDWERNNGFAPVNSTGPQPSSISSKVSRSKTLPTRGVAATNPAAKSPARASASHPYKDARANASRPAERIQASRLQSQEIVPLPEWLEDVLIDLGPQVLGGKRRRFVLCVFQGYERTIWVEEEVDDDVPEQIFQQLQKLVPQDTFNLILRNYSNPWIPDGVTERFQSVDEYHAFMAKFEVSDDEDEDEDEDEEYDEEDMEHSPPWPAGSSPYVIDSRSPGYTPPELSPAMGSNLALFSHELVPPQPTVSSSPLSRSASPPQGVTHYRIEQAAMGQQDMVQPVATYHATDYEVTGERNMEGYQEMNAQVEDTQTTDQFTQNTHIGPDLSPTSDVSQALSVQSPPQAEQYAQPTTSPEPHLQSQSPTHLQSQPEIQPQQIDDPAELESPQPDTLADWLNPEAFDEDAEAVNWGAFLNTMA